MVSGAEVWPASLRGTCASTRAGNKCIRGTGTPSIGEVASSTNGSEGSRQRRVFGEIASDACRREAGFVDGAARAQLGGSRCTLHLGQSEGIDGLPASCRPAGGGSTRALSPRAGRARRRRRQCPPVADGRADSREASSWSSFCSLATSGEESCRWAARLLPTSPRTVRAHSLSSNAFLASGSDSSRG